MTHNEVLAIVGQVRYKNWVFRVEGMNYLQAVFTAADHADASQPYEAHGRKWSLSPFMTKSEVVQTCLMAVLAAEEHEAREQFLYRGRAVFGPHYNVDRLFDLCSSTEVLEFRR